MSITDEPKHEGEYEDSPYGPDGVRKDPLPGTVLNEHAPSLSLLIEAIEGEGWVWEVGRVADGRYYATVFTYDGDDPTGSHSETDASSPRVALQSAYRRALGARTEVQGDAPPRHES